MHRPRAVPHQKYTRGRFRCVVHRGRFRYVLSAQGVTVPVCTRARIQSSLKRKEPALPALLALPSSLRQVQKVQEVRVKRAFDNYIYRGRMVPRFPCHLAPSPAAALASCGGLPDFCGGPWEVCGGPGECCGGPWEVCGGPGELVHGLDCLKCTRFRCVLNYFLPFW